MNPWQQPDPNAGPFPSGPPRPGPPPPGPQWGAPPAPFPGGPHPGAPQYPNQPGPPRHDPYPPQYPFQQQYPHQPQYAYDAHYPHVAQYPDQPAPSGTGIAAIALSVLIALLQGFAFIGYLAVASELSDAGNAIKPWVPTFLVVMGIARLLIAVGLIVGAVLLARRSQAGRSVVAGTAVATLLLQVVEYGVRASALPASGANAFSTISSVVLPIALVVVVLTASTRRWIDDGAARGARRAGQS